MNNSSLKSKAIAQANSTSAVKSYPILPFSQAPSHQKCQEIFFCPDESHFYSQCLERMVFNVCQDGTSIVEFGAGDGSPVINSLLKSQFNGLVRGYELNDIACKVAMDAIEFHRLNHRYVVHNSNFFDSAPADYLIANPPYIPAIDADIYMPALHGGSDGAGITKKLLEMNFPHAMLLISAYSDPAGIIEYAIDLGYQVEDFIASPMSFGYYSSEPKVKQRITELHQHRKAFYSQKIYMLSGVLFKKHHNQKTDLSSELIKIMTAL
jgi:methylase of polypeptide subunit release factors